MNFFTLLPISWSLNFYFWHSGRILYWCISVVKMPCVQYIISEKRSKNLLKIVSRYYSNVFGRNSTAVSSLFTILFLKGEVRICQRMLIILPDIWNFLLIRTEYTSNTLKLEFHFLDTECLEWFDEEEEEEREGGLPENDWYDPGSCRNLKVCCRGYGASQLICERKANVRFKKCPLIWPTFGT